jgi:hypothetical protein
MKKINLIDSLLLIGIFILFAMFLIPTKIPATKKTLAIYQTTAEVEAIYPEAQKATEIYLNTEKDPVKVVSVTKEDGKLLVTLEGPGNIEGDRYVFNKQRILAGQKAELHGKFWSQGIITKVEYAK